MIGVDQQDHALLLLEIGNARYDARLLLREHRCRPDRIARNLQDFRDRIDDESGSYAFDRKHHDPLTIVALDIIEVEPRPLIDYGQHGASQIDDTLDETGSLGQTR